MNYIRIDWVMGGMQATEGLVQQAVAVSGGLVLRMTVRCRLAAMWIKEHQFVEGLRRHCYDR